ncbi:MAG: zinc-dependent peptidase [Chromatiaceae bacterium]|nr:zinc-dependent peptidase [Chromatiaceae bacterium]
MPNPFAWLDHWRRRRILAKYPIGDTEWHAAARRIDALHGLSPDDLARLRDLAALFLRGKTINGAGGLQLDRQMRVEIAVQACLPILQLDIDWYDGWCEVIVYPETFRVRRRDSDDAGVVSEREDLLAGESWRRGPVVLSWHDVCHATPGENVVIHELAHKLDMLNGAANGMPPLHRGMSHQDWSATLGAAYAELRRHVALHLVTPIDAYAATNPGEFFAVASEYFFTDPLALLRSWPPVYRQLQLFYRQDPATRVRNGPQT